MIGKILQDSAIVPENIYNYNKTKVILLMLGFVKVLINKNNKQDYQNIQIKQITVTAIKYISIDGKYLIPIIIWLAIIHRSNWTIFPTPE